MLFTVLAIVGGAAVLGGIADQIEKSNYSDYSDYSNHVDYSDAAVQRARRVQAQQSSIRSAAEDLHDYKEDSVEPKLTSQRLKYLPAMRVDADEMDRDAKKKIQTEENNQIKQATAEERERIEEIDRLLKRIVEIQRES